MISADLVLIHPPSIFHFRELPLFQGPISDVIPSTSFFEGYPIGFLTMSEYLTRHGISGQRYHLLRCLSSLLCRSDPKSDFLSPSLHEKTAADL